jgi:intein-encoded DNA endonuclease-like protein
MFNENIAYLAGLMRDGGIVNYKQGKYEIWRVYITSKSRDLLEKTREIFIKEFGTDVTITKEKPNYFRLESRKKELATKIMDLFEFQLHQTFWNTPSRILESPLEIQKSYLKGFFDAEGTVIINSKPYNSCIKIYQSWNNENSCPPLEDLQKMLNKVGINSKVNFYYTLSPLHRLQTSFLALHYFYLFLMPKNLLIK